MQATGLHVTYHSLTKYPVLSFCFQSLLGVTLGVSCFNFLKICNNQMYWKVRLLWLLESFWISCQLNLVQVVAVWWILLVHSRLFPGVLLATYAKIWVDFGNHYLVVFLFKLELFFFSLQIISNIIPCKDAVVLQLLTLCMSRGSTFQQVLYRCTASLFSRN